MSHRTASRRRSAGGALLLERVAVALLVVGALFCVAPRAAFAQPVGQVNCDLDPAVFAENAKDEAPLEPACAARRLGSTSMTYPATFFRQHALCPDATVKATPTGAPQSLVLNYFSDADSKGATGEGTAYVISGVSSQKQSITAYTLGSQIINGPVPKVLDVTAFMSFAVNTSEFNAPLMFSDAGQDATVVWNYDADQKTGQILSINVAIFSPGIKAAADTVEAAARAAKIKGNCVEAFGPSNFTKTATGVEYFGVEDFATGRLMLFAQLQRGNCSVDSVVHLNAKPMATGCGVPAPPPRNVSRKLFLECGIELGLPFVIDAIKDVLHNSANQTVPTKEANIAASNEVAPSSTNANSSSTNSSSTNSSSGGDGGGGGGGTLQALRQRGSAIINAAVDAIPDVTGSFQYDDANDWALTLAPAPGEIPGPTNLTAVQLLRRILFKCSPFLDVQVNKGSVSNTSTVATFSYSSETQLLDVKFASKQALWLLSAAAKDVGALVGVGVPDPPAAGDDTPTLVTRVVTDRVNGLRLLSIGLDGPWTMGSLAARIGINWPFADDVVVVSSPNIVFVAPPSFAMDDGTVLPSSLRVNMLLTVPGIGLQNAVAGLVVQGSSTFYFLVYGSCTPVPSWPDFVTTAFAFTITNASGIVANVQAQLYDVPVNATINLNKGVLTATLTAADVAIVTILKNLFADVKIPNAILNFISPLTFADVSLTVVYDSSSSGKKLKFQFVAVPDIPQTSTLGKVLTKLKLHPSDVTLSLKPDGSGQNALAIGVPKPVEVPLPNPFLGPQTCVFAIQPSSDSDAAQNTSSPAASNPDLSNATASEDRRSALESLQVGVNLKALEMHASFTTALALKGTDARLNFSVAARLALGNDDPRLLLDAALISPFSVGRLPWLKLSSLSLTAEVGLSPPVLRKLVMTGSESILGSAATQLIVYSTNVQPPVFAMQASIDSFDLHSALGQMGLKANLGSFNLVVTSASLSYAPDDVTVNGVSVAQGVVVAGDVSLFGMLDSHVRLALDPAGTSFSVAVNGSVLNKGFTKFVLEPLTGTLKAASSACSAASSAANKTTDAIQKASDVVDAAQKLVSDKLASFLTYRKDVSSKLQAAQAKFNDALRAFDAAKAKVDEGAAAAQKALDDAVVKFSAVQDRVNQQFASAQAKVNDAQSNFDKWYNNLKAELDSKEEALNDLKDKVTKFNDNSCGCIDPCFWGTCRKCFTCYPQYALAVPALKVAQMALDTVQKILSSVNSAIPKLALDAARKLLDGAQRAFNELADSSEALAKRAAEKALPMARNAAMAVLNGTEAAARDAASSAFALAQSAADGIASSALYQASLAANATLQAAEAAFNYTKAMADKALNVVTAAIGEISGALTKLQTPGFFQLTGFSIAVNVSAAATTASASLQVTLGDTQLSPSVDLDPDSPLESIKSAVRSEGVAAVKKLFPGTVAALGAFRQQ